MICQQMQCIVVPVHAEHALAIQRCLDAPLLRQQLDAVFRTRAEIHFATLALLPPGKGKGAPGHSLLLEIVLDPGARLADAVVGLVDSGLEVLWQLLSEVAVSAQQRDGHWIDTTEQRRAQLIDLLQTHAHAADGGFVGIRDRSVRQIADEARLFRWLRHKIHGLGASAPSTADCADYAREQIKNTLGFEFALKTAPRDVWRDKRHGISAWLRRLASLIQLFRHAGTGAGVVALALFLAASLGLVLLALLFFGLLALAALPSMAATMLLNQPGQDWTTALGTHAPAAPVAFALLFGAFLVLFSALTLYRRKQLSFIVALGSLLVLPALFLTLTAWFESRLGWSLLDAGIGLAAWGAASLMLQVVLLSLAAGAFLLALLVLPRYLSAWLLFPLFLVFWVSGYCLFHRVWIDGMQVLAWFWPWLHGVLAQLQEIGLWPLDLKGLLCICAGTLLAVLTLLLWQRALLRLFKRLSRQTRSASPVVPAAQQCHPSLQSCDAELMGGANHMINLCDVRRDSAAQLLMLRLLMKLIMLAGYVWFTEGWLGRAQGIKFSHWHLIDGGRRLLFCANFDGSFGGYLDEFILGASPGINLTWRWTELRPRPAATPPGTGRNDQPGVSHGRAFPATRWWIFQGCTNEQAFKAYARDGMLPHLFIYQAYRLSNQDIDRNTRLRDALALAADECSDDQISRALES